jgi:hypothetical protein
MNPDPDYTLAVKKVGQTQSLMEYHWFSQKWQPAISLTKKAKSI